MILHYFHYESLDSSPASGPPSPPLRVPRPTRAAFVHHLASPAVFAAAGLVLALFAPAAARAQNPPTITGIESLAITSTPGNYHSSGKIYGPGETIAVTVTFNEAVTVDEGGGTPSLELDLSGTPTPALYRRGSGTTELVFERVVTDTDESRHGVAIGANKLELNGGTIRNQSGVDAGLIHVALERNRDHRVGDIVRIVDFSFEEVPAGGVYVIGDTVRLHAHFTGAVWVQGGWGSARVAISVGNDVRTARASSRTGDGNEQLVFDSYVVTEGDLDEDGLSLSANAVSGDIRYSTSLGAFEEHGEWSPPTPVRVDGVRPTVQSAVVNGPTLTLTFSETLNADSTPSPSAFTVGLGSLPALPGRLGRGGRDDDDPDPLAPLDRQPRRDPRLHAADGSERQASGGRGRQRRAGIRRTGGDQPRGHRRRHRVPGNHLDARQLSLERQDIRPRGDHRGDRHLQRSGDRERGRGVRLRWSWT